MLEKIFPILQRKPEQQDTVFLELYGADNCLYRLTGHGSPLRFSIEISREISRKHELPAAVLTDFTKDYYAADAFTRFLLDHGIKPEGLPCAAAEFFAGNQSSASVSSSVVSS